MAELHVRNLPPELHQRLRERASSQGRSMSSEAIVLLGQALRPPDAERDRQRAAIDRLRSIRRRSLLGADAPPAEQMVRQDRDTPR